MDENNKLIEEGQFDNNYLFKRTAVETFFNKHSDYFFNPKENKIILNFNNSINRSNQETNSILDLNAFEAQDSNYFTEKFGLLGSESEAQVF